MTKKWLPALLWLFAAAYLAATLICNIFALPQAFSAALLTLLLVAFVLLHGAAIYSLRGILAFLVICLVVSNFFENLSITTGFPFGHYHYGDGLGPKLFLVPMLIGPAYIGGGYLAWTIARAILGDRDGGLRGTLALSVPIIAAFVMVAWDLTMDPMMSTLRQNWIWEQGGSYFGVPLSNYLGWYLTVFVFYVLFALYARKKQTRDIGYWPQALLAYLALASQPLLSFLVSPEIGGFADATGKIWQAEDIKTVDFLASLLTLLPFVLMAAFRVMGVGTVEIAKKRV